MADITREFDEPFYSNSTVSPTPIPYVSPSIVGIGGIAYLMDTASGVYRRESFDVVQQRNNASQRDLLLLPQDVWRQQSESWHLGAGQSNIDRDNSLTYRYEDSFGIDPWTNQWQYQLLNKVDRQPGSDTVSGTLYLTTTKDRLVLANENYLYWYSSLGSASIGSTAPPSGFKVKSLITDGLAAVIMAMSASQTHVYSIDALGGSWTQWGSTSFSLNTTFIGYQKDYMLVGDGNVLKEAPPSGAANTVFTHPDPDFRWYSSASGDSCIYVMGRLGDRTTIHRVNIKQDGTGLQPCIVAAVLPDGETGYAIDSYLGIILIGTDKGVRIATRNNDSGDLTLGPTIPTKKPVLCFEGQERFVWYGNNEMDSAYTVSGSGVYPSFPTTCAGLGRLDLSVATTSALTPAYANDLAATSVSTGNVRGVVTFQGKRVFCIDNNGLYYQTDQYMDGGWLKEGTMSFGVEDSKTGLYLQGKWLPLTGKIGLDVAYDSTFFQRVGTMEIQGSIRSGNVSLNGEQFSRINARTILIRDPNQPLTTPVFTRWELRAIPGKGRASRWTLPIMNYEEIEIDGVKYTRDPLETLNTLLGYGYSGELVILQEAGQAYQTHVKEYSWQPEKLSINGQAWEGTLVLVLEEVA